MDFGYSKLRERIIGEYRSQTEFVKSMGWSSERVFQQKIHGKTLWKGRISAVQSFFSGLWETMSRNIFCTKSSTYLTKREKEKQNGKDRRE